MEKQILKNLEALEKRIHNACKLYNRDPKQIKVLLATKTVSAQNIQLALKNGYTCIAENKVQELKAKFEDLKHTFHSNHFIGYLQTNKIKDLIKYSVSCIHSIDRLELAEKLHKRLVYENKTMDVLIQVNTSFEQSKFGIEPQRAAWLVEQVSKLPTLKIKGLMTIGVFSNDFEKVGKCFDLLKSLQQEITSLNIDNVQLTELSMGMSNDLEIAIEKGATILRIGTAVFGQRSYPDSYYWNENKD
ncbi:YggS family pyridoxal phosphate-dependent enzyme [Myroides sp. LJL119]